MSSPRKIVETLLSSAGIAIGGTNPWDITVKDERFFARVLREKNLGLGESYMEGWWDCRQPDEFIYHILKSRLDVSIKEGLKCFSLMLPSILFNLQSKVRAHIVAKRHYDLDNNLFLSILDPYNQYSCACFEGTADLDQAQKKKLDMICRKIAVGRADHVLDIGCGWGGFAKYASETYGCTVTAANISWEQIRYAKEFCRGLPVRFLECDYRGIQGQFDKIVSIGMFEHVGWKNYGTFMRVAHRCLKDDGIFLLHTIGGNRSTRSCDPWITKFIFPNGMLPSIAQISRSIEAMFVVEDWHNLGPHYDKTLMAWNHNFQKAWPRLQEKYDAKFKRMWEYYLLSCAGAFRARSNQVWQIVLTKFRTDQPICRF